MQSALWKRYKLFLVFVFSCFKKRNSNLYFCATFKVLDDVVSQTLARWLAYFHFLEAKKMILSKSYAFLSKDVRTN